MFTEINVKIKYKSFIDNLLDDFYIPILSDSKLYYRAVGYFSSSALVEYARGLRAFINNKGKLKLIISPYLTKNDYNNLVKYGKSTTKKLINDMFYEFLNADRNTLLSSQLLVALINNNILELKVAQPKNSSGMFHEKIGLFYDFNDNIIAISGSNNETYGAFKMNHESFNTFCSWKEGQTQYVTSHLNDFNSYWENKSYNIDVIDFKDAIDKDLFKKLTTDRDIDEIFDYFIEEEPSKYDTLKFNPYGYQRDAVDKWFINYEGIFKFATGAGKTKTAILLMERLKKEYDKLFFVIVVPDKTLVNQWADELEENHWKPLKCFSDTTKWNVEFKNRYDIYTYKEKIYEYVITTNDTFFNIKFQRELKRLNNDYLLVVDECHTWGTERILGNLPMPKFKLGLSATPELFFSESKTQRVLNFFGGIVHEYSLKQAIEDEKLVGYYYHPIFVELTSKEKESYDELTRRIVKMIGSDIDDYNDKYDKALQMLLFKRARIIYGAISKLNKLSEMIVDLNRKGRLLIYCGPTAYSLDDEQETQVYGESITQLQKVNQILSEKNIKFAQYTSKENESDRFSAIKQFKNDTYSTLVAIKCLDEGVNIPEIERAVILASSTNPREFIQRRGRILRQNPGKKFAEIYDFIVYDNDYESLIKKEISRMYEFSKIALNKNDLFEKYNDLFIEYVEGEL